MQSLDWYFWITEDVSVRLDWWPGAEHYWYVFLCRAEIVLFAALVVLAAMVFFAYAHTRFQELRRS